MQIPPVMEWGKLLSRWLFQALPHMSSVTTTLVVTLELQARASVGQENRADTSSQNKECKVSQRKGQLSPVLPESQMSQGFMAITNSHQDLSCFRGPVYKVAIHW